MGAFAALIEILQAFRCAVSARAGADEMLDVQDRWSAKVSAVQAQVFDRMNEAIAQEEHGWVL